MRSRRALGAICAIAGLFLSVAGVAWACTESSFVAATPVAGTAGELVTVRAWGAFETDPATPIEIRWNEVSGPLVGTAAGPGLATEIRVPEGTAPGFYYLVAVQRDVADHEGQVTTRRAAQTFEVTGGPPGGSSGSGATAWSRSSPGGQGSSTPNSLLAGVGLLGLGLAGLAAGCVVAVVRPRRARVQSHAAQ